MISVLAAWNGKPIVDVLSIALSISKGKAKDLLDRKCVFINNHRIWIAKHKVNTGDIIEVIGYKKENLNAAGTKKTEAFKPDILHQDQWVLIVNKPYGLNTNENNSIEKKVQNYYKNNKIKAVHRLDKDTSGALIMAKDDEVFKEFVKVFSSLKIKKVYSAIVVGAKDKPLTFTVSTPLDGKTAISEIQVKKTVGDVSLLQIRIETGRTHQIRRHLKSVGVAILGDKEYSTKLSSTREYREFARQMLHAHVLEFIHPFTDEKISIKAKYYDDFNEALRRFKL